MAKALKSFAPAALLALAATPAATQAQAQTAVSWREAPSLSDVAAAYPAKARAEGLAGRAILYCDLSAGGRLSGCLTLDEQPLGAGFAAAAHRLTDRFRADLDARERLAHGGVTLAVAFDPAMLKPGAAPTGRPDWTALPTAADVQGAFAATPKNVGEVRVVLTCTVQPGGDMGGCGVDSEAPAGEGFGQAALTLAEKARVSAWTADGRPAVGETVRIPIRFETGQPAPKAP